MKHLSIEQLDGYITGELGDADAEAFEEAMFDAPADADLEFVDRLARHGAQLVSHGTFDMGVPRGHIDELRARGLAVQLIEAGPPGRQTIVLDRTADLIATRLPIGRTDLERVDVEITLVDHGNATKVIKDALVDRSEGAIYGLCERTLAELAWGMGETLVHVRERDGKRALIAEWHFDTGTPATT